ncbi:unnamed protein product [Calicophoron daubneyi]|uniref:Flavoprotein domain-containing protein n=1 Tax=Calicophoron daubneyi TaxID=300641 RepID=A0AAV2SZ72_CALDB
MCHDPIPVQVARKEFMCIRRVIESLPADTDGISQRVVNERNTRGNYPALETINANAPMIIDKKSYLHVEQSCSRWPHRSTEGTWIWPPDSDKLNVLLAVTGSVAAIKTPELVAKLIEANYNIQVVATTISLQFFKRDDLSVPVFTDENEWTTWSKRGDKVLHIELRNWADILLIAPLSANTLAKLAYGMADNLVTTIARAWWWVSENQRSGDLLKPVYFAPSMNTGMWEHPFTSEQINRLTGKLRWTCIPPITKVLMCGEYGNGAMAEPKDIVDFIRNRSLLREGS